jgi:hypothetical protein
MQDKVRAMVDIVVTTICTQISESVVGFRDDGFDKLVISPR